MDLVDHLKCTLCQEQLKNPVVLPCGHCICKHHEQEATENNEARNIECKTCNESFDIPFKGFIRVRPLEIELEKKAKSEEEIKIKAISDRFSFLEQLINDFNEFKNDPETKINDVINELRNKVDLRREEMKQEIDRESLKMIDKLNEFEKECREKTQTIKSDDCKLDEKFANWRKDLIQRKESLETCGKNMDSLDAISTDLNSALKEIQSEFRIFNEKLSFNRITTFKLDTLTSISNFDLMSVEIKNLSDYIDLKDKIEIISHNKNAFGIEWRLKVGVDLNYINVFLKPQRFGNIKVEYDFVILDQFHMGKNFTKSFVKLFESDGYWGNNRFFSLKSLVNNYNFYNAQNDSCTIQVVLKRIEWL